MVSPLVVGLFMLLAPAACLSPREVISDSVVSELGTNPASLGLTWRTDGLKVIQAYDIAWKTCAVSLQTKLSAAWALTDRGIPVAPAKDHLIMRDWSVGVSADKELPHPRIAGARYISSTALQVNNQRAGYWLLGDGSALIARYTPRSNKAPAPIIRSTLPLLGIFYLPSPDTVGGLLTLWQRLPKGKYRSITVEWSEDRAH